MKKRLVVLTGAVKILLVTKLTFRNLEYPYV